MDDQILLIAFVAFVVIVLVVALIFRKAMVDDVFSDESPSFSASDAPFSSKVKNTILPTTKSVPMSQNTVIGSDKPSFVLNRQNLNTLGKIIGAVGAVMIFAPLPSSLEGISFGIAFIGYILVRFTAAPKTQKTGAAKSSTVDTLRRLASKPEYREAMQILSADIADKKFQSDVDRQRRAIRYLQSKGVSDAEATRNVALLAKFVSQQAKR